MPRRPKAQPNPKNAPLIAGGEKGGRKRRLKSIRNVRSLVADTLRAVEDAGRETKTIGAVDRARVLFHGSQVLATIIRDSDLEERLKRVELAMEAGSKPTSTSGGG